MTTPRTAVMIWDWREQPNLDRLDYILCNLSAPHLRMRAYRVDTGSDQYALVISTDDLDEPAIQAAYRHELEQGA